MLPSCQGHGPQECEAESLIRDVKPFRNQAGHKLCKQQPELSRPDRGILCVANLLELS